MDVNGLKQLSNDTFFDNEEGLITPETHRAFNDKTIDFIQAGYTATYIVDSAAALGAWADKVAGNDYSHVLIKPGQYIYSKPVNLTTAGTKTVVGMAGNMLFFTAEGRIVGSGIFGHEHFIMGVNVQVVGVDACCFQGCSHLIKCSGTVKSGSAANAVFRDCGYLSDCVGYNISANASAAVTYENCMFLTNCYASSNVPAGRSTLDFNNCSCLTNCYSESIAGASATSFYKCENLTNCVAAATCAPGGSSAIGFNNCKKLVNCTGMGNSTDGTGNANGYGFFNCKGMFMCSPLGVSKTMTYGMCSMLQNTTKPVGETAEGGYNWLE